MDSGKADTGLAPDAGVDRAPDAIADAGRDAVIDGALLDTGRADSAGDVRADTASDVRADGTADVPLDARDAGVDTRDAERDVPIFLDGATIDGGQVDGRAGETGAVDAPPLTLVATLSGAQVVPPVTTSATAVANFAVSPDGNQVMYHIMQTVTGANSVALYVGAAGTNGTLVFALTPVAADMTGTLTLTRTQIDSLESGMMYVLVTSAVNPNGELRGQILLPGQSLWVAKLTGAQEVPATATTATGQAAFILSADQATLRYQLATTGLTVLGARIDMGIAGMLSTGVHQLTPVSETMDGVVVVSPADVQNLMQRRLSINVATVALPNGEIRGQILMPGEILYSAMMSGDQETPPVNPSAVGAAQFVLAPSATSLSYEATWSNLTGPATASHIHTGAIGVAGPIRYPLTLNATGTGVSGVLTITAADLTALNGGQLYVNAHTAANPAGEVRGQLGKQ